MSRPSTSYGRVQCPEPPSNLASLHLHDGTTPLKEVTHEPPLAVLDQEDLVAQGITVAEIVAGAKAGTDALGSCTANATMAALSGLGDSTFAAAVNALGFGIEPSPTLFADAKTAEEAAICFYHRCTDQTGTPGQEWPPTDCGSSGPYIVQELQRLDLVSGQRIAHGAQNLVSLLQGGGVLEGTPFLNAWEDPGPGGVVDGNGTAIVLQSQIAQGVAGGHETYISAIEKLTLTETGLVVPQTTVLRVRNSWSASWGDHGSFYLHLSALVALGAQCDFRRLVA